MIIRDDSNFYSYCNCFFPLTYTFVFTWFLVVGKPLKPSGGVSFSLLAQCFFFFILLLKVGTPSL